MILKYSILAFLVFSVHSLSARDCSTKDLNDGPNSPFQTMPIYDQDGSSSCYGHTAATLINYEHLKSGQPMWTGVHPLYAAWQYKIQKDIKAKDLEFGLTKETIEAISANGNCDKQSSEMIFNKLKKKCAYDTTDAQFINLLETIFELGKVPAFYIKDSEVIKIVKFKLKDKLADCQIDSLITELKANDMFRISSIAAMNKMFAECKIQKLNIPKPKHFDSGTDSQMLDILDNALASGKPAEIAMCSNMFSNLNYKLKGETTKRGSVDNVPENCDGHSVVITGRKMVSGVCKYLVRNSWGAKWKAPATMSCSCYLVTGGYKDVCTDPTEVAEYAGCWFNEGTLGRNIMSITHF